MRIPSQKLAAGLPLGIIGLVAAVTLIWLILAAREDRAGAPALATAALRQDDCALRLAGSRNAVSCVPADERTYDIGFRDSLAGSDPLVELQSCCGRATADLIADRLIRVVLVGRVRYPATVSVVAP